MISLKQKSGYMYWTVETRSRKSPRKISLCVERNKSKSAKFSKGHRVIVLISQSNARSWFRSNRESRFSALLRAMLIFCVSMIHNEANSPQIAVTAGHREFALEMSSWQWSADDVYVAADRPCVAGKDMGHRSTRSPSYCEHLNLKNCHISTRWRWMTSTSRFHEKSPLS